LSRGKEQCTTPVGSFGGKAAVGRKSLSGTGNEHVIPDTKGRQSSLLG